MSTAVSEPQTVEPQHDPSVPDVTLLEDKMPEWFRSTKYAAGYAVMIGAVYWLFAMLPIWHTDVWGHLSYGRHIWETKSLPVTEPLMPLSKGIPFVDTAWLSQLIGYGAHQLAGRAALKFLFGASIAVATGLLAWRMFERTRSGLLTAFGTGLFLWGDYQQLRVMRPQIAGVLLFCGLLFWLSQRKLPQKAIYLVPVLFALWANLHGSFLVGIGLLGAYTVGRAIDVLRRTGQIKAVLGDSRVRQYFVLTELAAAAVLLNPYGLSIYDAVLSASSNPNMGGIVEWQALTLRHDQGKAAAAAALILIFLYRVSPRRLSSAEVISVFGLGLASLWSSRFVTWFAPVVALQAAIHAGATLRHWRRASFAYDTAPRTSFWSVVSIGLLFVAFSASPIGVLTMPKLFGDEGKSSSKVTDKTTMIEGKTKKVSKKNVERFTNAASEHTPEAVTEWLVKNPPKGQVFNTYEWGDYLLWAGPKDMQVVMASHAQFISPVIWDDYIAVVEGGANWETHFDRYSVNTVILDLKFRGPLILRMAENEQWKIVYRDAQAAVFKRKKPI